MWLERIGKMIKGIHIIGSRTCDLPVCSLMPQSLRYRVPKHMSFLILYSILQNKYTVALHNIQPTVLVLLHTSKLHHTWYSVKQSRSIPQILTASTQIYTDVAGQLSQADET